MSSASSASSASIAIRASAAYSVDDTGVEHEAPERHESEFARALEADFKRRALALSAAQQDDEDVVDDNNNGGSGVGGVGDAFGVDGESSATTTKKASSKKADADATEKQWFEIYQNLTHARGEIGQAHTLIETLIQRRFLTALQLPTMPPTADLVAQQRRIAVQAKREQLNSAATKIFVHCESLRSQLVADRVYFSQLRQLCQRWRLVLADNGTLMFDYVPLLTAALDVSSVHERAVCVRVQNGNVALRLPPMRVLALGRRVGVYCGARRIAFVDGPIAPPPSRAAGEPHGVEHCDDLLVRARQSVWLERMFVQLVREAAVLPTDVAYLAEDRRESEHRAVCVVLSLADDAKPLVISFQLEPIDDASESGDVAMANVRKRRFAADGNDDENKNDAGDDANDAATNDTALVALASVLDSTLSRLCDGVQRQHCRRLALWNAAESAAPLPSTDEDKRVEQWLTSDDEGDAKPKILPVAHGLGGATTRAKFHAYFGDAAALPTSDTAVSLVKATRILYAQCRSEAVVRGALVRLQELVFGTALRWEWQSGGSPFECQCIIHLGESLLDTVELIDGDVRAHKARVPAACFGTVQQLQFVLRDHATVIERWLKDRSTAEKNQIASRIGAATLDAVVAIVDV